MQWRDVVPGEIDPRDCAEWRSDRLAADAGMRIPAAALLLSAAGWAWQAAGRGARQLVVSAYRRCFTATRRAAHRA